MELNKSIWAHPRTTRRFRFILVVCICLFFSEVDAPALRKGANSGPLLIADRGIARILNIVVEGKQKDEGITISEAHVKRASDDPTIPVDALPVAPGMFLYTMDELATGPGVNVTIVFLPDDDDSSNEPRPEYQEVLVQEKTAIRISNPRRGKLRTFFGGIMASVYGFFNASSGSGYTLAKHTDFEFRINPDGRGDVLVLEGLVTFQRADFEEPRLGEGTGYWQSFENFAVVKNQSSDARRVIDLKNSCAEQREFNILPSPNLSWIKLDTRRVLPNLSSFQDDGLSVKLDAGKSLRLPLLIKFETENVAVESYPGTLRIECPDCPSDCKPKSLPLHVTVLPDDGVPVAEGKELDFNNAGPIASPSPASIERIRKAAELLSQIFKATRLRHSPPVIFEGGLPAFSTVEERETSFDKAIIDAVLKTDPNEKAAAYEMLGDVYRSVGEYEKAEHAYVKAANYDLQRKHSRLLAIKRLDATIGIPTFSKFDEPYNLVAKRLDDQGDDRLFTLAHIVMGRAELSLARDGFMSANSPSNLNQLINARRFFEHVLRGRKNYLSSLSKQERSTFWLNYGMVLETLGVYWLEDGKFELAKTNYADARKCFDKAKRSDPTNPYVSTNLSFALTGLGNVERYLSKGETARVRDYYRKSERELSQISAQLLAARNARAFLQASQGGTIKFEKIRSFTLSAMTHSYVYPKVDGMLVEVAAELIARKGLIPTVEVNQQPVTTRRCVKPDPHRAIVSEDRISLVPEPCS